MSQSLPSFAQAFSSSSLSETSPISNALPPIQSHSPPATTTAKKRARGGTVDPLPDVPVRIKEEDKDDPPTRASSATPSSKKRRVNTSEQCTFLDQRRASMSAAIVHSPPPRVSPQVVQRCASSSHASPPPIVAQPPDPAPQHALPPPPISFARRRAAQSGSRKKKPADIVISPRSAGPSDPLAPVIQSAPPVADPGRFPMAIPRLPLALNNTHSTRRVATNVPPTPTRFGLHTTTAAAAAAPPIARPVHSPPQVSVPIANTLVPPTPHALHHPGYSGGKSAFLAPFELFYDALNDSKQLKGWLSEQLQKSNALMTSLRQQQDKLDETVEDLVEKRTRVMREEITMLRQRMESLEEALLAVRAQGYPQTHQNGAGEPYHFPAQDGVTCPAQDHQPSVSPPVDVSRRPSLSLARGSAKGARSTTARPTESRPRMYYPGPVDKS